MRLYGCCITIKGVIHMQLQIGFIGAGKVGVNLGRYFTQKGIYVVGFYDCNIENAKEAAHLTNTHTYSTIELLVKASQIIFITTPDDFISKIGQIISSFSLQDKFICHCSGSLSSNSLICVKNAGGFIYSIHPIFPFSNKYIPIKELETMCFSVEGDIDTKNKKNQGILDLLDSLPNFYFTRKKSQNASYHLANVMVSNLVLSLLHKGVEYFKLLGLSEQEALAAIQPLVKVNIENIFSNGFSKSLTGPVARGDISTVKRHLETTQNNEDKKIYQLLSRHLLTLVPVYTDKHNQMNNELKEK